MSEAIAVLRDEHRRILAVFDRFEQRCSEPEKLSAEYVEALLAFIEIFIDGNHHGKEERALFGTTDEHPWLSSFALLLNEQHTEGRLLVRAVRCARGRGESGLPELRAFIAFLRDHIARENDAIFVSIEQALDENSNAALLERFAEIEREVIARWKIAEPGEEHREIGDLRRWEALLVGA